MCLITSVALCGIFALHVNAANGITTDEQQIVDALKAGVKVGDKTVSVPIECINQTETFLVANDVEASVVTGILADIEGIKTVIMENNITDLKEIKGAVATEIFAKAQATARKVGITLQLNADNTIDVLDKDGKIIFTTGMDRAIKDTGDDFTLMFMVTGAIALILGGTGIIASKKGYLQR